MAPVRQQVDLDVAKKGAERYGIPSSITNIVWAHDLKTVYYAQFLARMRLYFDSWQALLDHFKDLVELSWPHHFLHKSAATRLEGALKVLNRKSLPSISNAFSLRGFYFIKVQDATQMIHAMGYALDISPTTNPALKQRGQKGLEKNDMLHIAAIIRGSPGMHMDAELDKSGGFMRERGMGPNETFIESMGRGDHGHSAAKDPDAKTKKYFEIFEKQFRKMEEASKNIRISISPDNQRDLIALRSRDFALLILSETMHNLLNIERTRSKIDRSKIESLEKLITDLVENRKKILKEVPKFMTMWIKDIDAAIAKEEVALKPKGLEGRSPSVVRGELMITENEMKKAKNDLTQAHSSKASAMAERDAAQLISDRDMDSEVEDWKKHHSPPGTLSERTNISFQNTYRKQKAVEGATNNENEKRQELTRVTSSLDAFAKELKATEELEKSKLKMPEDRELLEKWENVTMLREHRKWLTTPNLKTPTDVDKFERLIFGNLRETLTNTQLNKAGLKAQEALVENPALVTIATKGYIGLTPGVFDLDFFEEMAHWGFWPGVTWKDPVDTMHFELVEGRNSIKQPSKKALGN